MNTKQIRWTRKCNAFCECRIAATSVENTVSKIANSPRLFSRTRRQTTADDQFYTRDEPESMDFNQIVQPQRRRHASPLLSRLSISKNVTSSYHNSSKSYICDKG